MSEKTQSNQILGNNDEFIELERMINKLTFPQNAVYVFNINDFNYLNDIYLGQMNTVKRYLHKPSRNIVVAKITLLPTKDYKDEFKLRQFTQEIKALMLVSECPAIVKFYGLCILNNYAYIFMEFMDLSLRELYETVHLKGKFPEQILGFIAISMVDALDFCSKRKIIHRDLKPGNVLLNKRGEIKLCDFGVSKISEESCSSTFVGTVAYWPPERFIMTKMRYDIRSDIWSLGITLAEVALGKHPFICLNESALSSLATIQDYIVTFNKSSIMTFFEGYSKYLAEFVKSCLKKYSKRPKCQQLMELKFYSGNKPIVQDTVAKFLENIFMHDKNLSFYDNLRQKPVINQIKFLDDNKVYGFDINDFEKINEISKKVGRYRHKPSNKEMAIKIVSTSNNHNAMGEINKQIINSLVKEIPSFYDLQNESNIVQFYGLGVCEERVLICMELMDMSLRELCHTIHTAQLPFPEQLLGCLVASVINALTSCKVCDVVNHAIKPENIFINKKRQIKLSCFDRSRFSEAIFETINAKENLEFMYYWPYEKFQADVEQTDYKADIWSLGITLCELAYGVIPFLYENNYPAIKDISDLKYMLKTLDTVKLISETFSAERYSEDLREFVKLCLLPVDKRPRYNLLMKTTFYRTYEFLSFEDDNQVFKCIQSIEARLGKEL